MYVANLAGRSCVICCLSDVRRVCVCVGYSKVLFEDQTVNVMHEDLNLFEETVKNPLFEKTPIFLFLNKKDLFEAMSTLR